MQSFKMDTDGARCGAEEDHHSPSANPAKGKLWVFFHVPSATNVHRAIQAAHRAYGYNRQGASKVCSILPKPRLS
jgi:hypothetical protein